MAFYRFLFAPVLLAVAVLIGARERAGAPSPAPPAAQARPAATSAAPLAPAKTRAGPMHPTAVR